MVNIVVNQSEIEIIDGQITASFQFLQGNKDRLFNVINRIGVDKIITSKTHLNIFTDLLIEEGIDCHKVNIILSNIMSKYLSLDISMLINIISNSGIKLDLLKPIDGYISLYEFIRKDFIPSLKLLGSINMQGHYVGK